MLQDKDRGDVYDVRAFGARVGSAVAEAVHKQIEVGIDIVSDGELSKNSFTNYVKDRLSGLDAVNPDPYPSRPPLFPEYAESLRARAVNLGTRPLNTEPFGWKNFGEVERDITNLESALQGARYVEAFMPA